MATLKANKLMNTYPSLVDLQIEVYVIKNTENNLNGQILP